MIVPDHYTNTPPLTDYVLAGKYAQEPISHLDLLKILGVRSSS